MNFNKILIGGRLTRDPELTYLPSTTAVAEFSLATSHKYKANNGEVKEDVCYVDCRCYGAKAEAVNKYVHKGDPLFVEGRLMFDRWEAQDGTRRSKHRVFVEKFEFMGKQSSNEQSSNTEQSGALQEQPKSDNGNQNGYGADEDIPF